MQALEAVLRHGLPLVAEISTLAASAALCFLFGEHGDGMLYKVVPKLAPAVASATIACAVAIPARKKQGTESTSASRIPVALVCALVLVAVSPVLGSLTRPYSDDTVSALAAACGVARLYVRFVGARDGNVPAAAAAFLYCLLLASRMNDMSRIACFLVTFSLAFTVVPWCFIAVYDVGARSFYSILVASYAASAARLLSPSRRAVAAFLASCAIFGIVLPAAFAYMRRRCKRRIPRSRWEPLRVIRD